MAEVPVHIDGRTLTLSNLDKILYPETGFTKAQIVDYYARIAPVMLPHLRDRPLTLVRYPDGVEGKSFFEKRRPPSAPEWVEAGGELGSLELHTHQHTEAAPDLPTAVVLDLDPGPPATVLDCAKVALDLRSVLDRLGLLAVVKTSGSKGLHLSIPIATGTADDETTKGFALALGRLLAEATPKQVTIAMAKDQRGGKVFLDWSQNDRHKTTVAAYSLRARARPTVSTPVTWAEVEQAVDEQSVELLAFETDHVLTRVSELGDLYAPNLHSEQTLPTLA
jgi:bifunctional non-homologous end joining protein LigD